MPEVGNALFLRLGSSFCTFICSLLADLGLVRVCKHYILTVVWVRL